MPTASHFTQCNFNLAWPRIGHRRPRHVSHLAITDLSDLHAVPDRDPVLRHVVELGQLVAQ